MTPQKLVIIGIDGADSDYIKSHADDLPNFAKWMRKYQGNALLSDITPRHSAPCWASVFAGDTLGLKDFVLPEQANEMTTLENAPWLWKGRENACFVAGIPITLPPIQINAPEHGWVATTLAITASEMAVSTWTRTAQLVTALRQDRFLLVATVFPALDRAGHIWGMDDSKTLQQYRFVDEQLFLIEHWLEPTAWVALSDHGMISNTPSDAEPDDGRKGWHGPHGIIMSNMANPPQKLSQVYRWINGE